MNFSANRLAGEIRRMLKTVEARADLDRLIASPEAQAMFDRSDSERVDEMRPLAAELKAGMSPAEKKQIDAAAREAAKAIAVESDAAAHLRAATESRIEAQRRAWGLDMGYQNRMSDLTRKLKDGANPRIATAIEHVLDIGQMARHMGWLRPILGERSWVDGQRPVEMVGNVDIVEDAFNALKTATRALEAMQLEALSTAEVTERLHALFHKLAPALQPLGLAVLDLDEAGEITRDRSRSRGELVERALREGAVA